MGEQTTALTQQVPRGPGAREILPDPHALIEALTRRIEALEVEVHNLRGMIFP